MKLKIDFKSIIKQVTLILLFPIGFIWTSYGYLNTKFSSIPGMVICGICLTICFGGMVLYLIFDWFRRGKKIELNKCIVPILLGIASVIILLPTLDELPRWDGFLYYSLLENVCEKFDFTINGILNGFRTVHPSHAYMMFLAIGYYVFDNHLLGALFMQMILFVVMALSYYGILSNLCPQQKHTTYLLGTTMFLMAPLVFGIEPQINPDYGTLCYLVLFIYVALKKRLLLEWWCAMCLVMSKPQGILYYTAYYAAVFFVREYRYIIKNKAIDIVEIGRVLLRTIPGFIFIIYYLVSNYNITSFSSSMNSVENASERVAQGFGINWEYILVKLKEIFLLNFIWVFYAIVLSGIIILLFRKGKQKVYIREELYGIGGVGFVFLIFNCVYITYANARYLSVGTFVVSIFTFGMLMYLVKNKKKLLFILLLLTQLNVLASYASVDPITHNVFNSFSVGKGRMYLPIYDDVGIYPSDIYSDPTVYNRQFIYYTKLLEKMLDETGYNGMVPILLVDMSKGQHKQGKYDYINTMLEGLWGRKTLYWNDEEKRLDMNSDNIKMNVIYFSSEQIINGTTNAKSEMLPKEAIFVHLPRQGTEIIDIISNFYNVEATYNIEDYEMSLMAYRIKMK